MGPLPENFSLPGHPRLFAALLALGALLSCESPTDPGENIHTLEILVPSTVLRPGREMFAVAEARDASGVLLEGLPVRWRSLDPSLMGIEERNGRVVARAPGIGRIRASVGSKSAELVLHLVNPPAATLANSVDTLRLALPSGFATISATARDAEGLSILKAPLQWESSAARIASVSDAGAVNVASAGTAKLISHVEGLADTTIVIVTAPVSENGPVVVGTLPAVAVPGQTLNVTGQRFSTSLLGNQVMLDGIAVQVISASAAHLTLSLPPATQFECVPTGPVALQVTTSGGIGVGTVTLQMAPQRALGVGQSIVVPGGLESECLELAPSTGRYIVTVQNTARSLSATGSGAGFAIYATATSDGAPLAAAASRADALGGPQRRGDRRVVVGAREPSLRRGRDRDRDRDRAHARVLGMNRDAARRAATLAKPRAGMLRSASVVDPVLGALRPVRVPRFDLVPANCNLYQEIGTRTAFVGPHLVILEDTTPTFNGGPTLRGQLDALYQQIGAEFEAVTWPLLQVFGNPLVKDANLDDNGRVAVVFTPRMNALLGGSLLAATSTCDLYPRQLPGFQASDAGEYVYAQVPLSTGPGAGPGTTERWLWSIRATLAHELKHVVSYAERTSRPALENLPEEEWLEEATARHAEELFTRQVYGTMNMANHGFDATLDCEAAFGTPSVPAGCDGLPRAMLPHFEGLWDFLDSPTQRSPLGPTLGGDFSHYGSAWSLTRWLLDHSGIPEDIFFRQITLSPSTGVQNLETRVGRAWPDLLGEWSLMLAVDDRAGFTPQSPRLSFASWNLPDIFQGLCDELGPCVDAGQVPSHYPRAHPLQPVVATVGDFTVEFPSVRAGSFGVIDISGGSPTTRLLLALRGFRGAPLPADAKLSIVRIE